MKNVIQMINPTEFTLEARGNDFTLLKNSLGEWEMFTSNASTKAWNSRGMPSVKYFDDLKAVEANYKSWRGIDALVSDLKNESKAA